MQDQRFRRIKELFHRTVDLSDQERAALLDRECAGDSELRAEVERLLATPSVEGEERIRAAMGRFPGGVSAEESTSIHDGTPGHEPHHDIDAYNLLEKIGEGGMGEVWLAEQTQPVHRRVALKIIKRGMDTKRVVARFEAERQALALMNHSSIAKVFDAGETPDGRPYFVMEYVPGVPITEYCDRERLSNNERLALFAQVCEGVQHAHQKAIIHRDIKPSNVLVTVNDGKAVPKIIDFGVARATAQRLTEKTLFTELGVLIGTPEYMSPEQAESTGEGVDTRTDVYSLGVMMYELLVGALPFDPEELRGKGFEGILRMIRTEEPQKPSARLSTLRERSIELARRRRMDLPTLRRDLRGDLDWITMKALEKDRSRRYGSPAELAADVARHIADEPVLARPASTAYRARKFAKRHRFGVTVAAAGIAALIGFAATMAVQARRIAAEREVSDKVSEFLANILGGVEPRDLGSALSKDLHEQVADVRLRRGASHEEIEKTLGSLDEALSGVNATEVALRLLDEQVLARAANAIEQDRELDPRIAGRLEHTLGDTYRKLGLYEPAEQHARRAVAIREQALGSQHPEVLSSRTVLANVYWLEGRYAEAEKLHRETLEIRRQVLGRDHLETFRSINNLASVYWSQGRYAEAERLYKEVLEIRRRLLGQNHLDTLSSMHNLAAVYERQRRYAEAEKLENETFEIKRQVLGRDHPDTLASLNALATLYLYQGRHAEAEKLHRETLEIRRRVLGQKHPNTLDSMNNLAMAYQRQGRYSEAEKLHRETLENRRQFLGRNHPSTLKSMQFLANMYVRQGRYAEAERLHEEALEIQRCVLGQVHPDTILSMYNLACIAALQGDRKMALDGLRQAVDSGFKRADEMAKDDNLKLLHGDPEFKAIVARARDNAAKSKQPRPDASTSSVPSS